MNGLQKIEFTRGLNTDNDPLRLLPGEYDAALNCRHLTDSTQSTQSIVPIKGNEFATLILPTNAQAKIYSIAIDSVNTTTGYILVFKDQNGIVFATTPSFSIGANANILTSYNAAGGMANALTTAIAGQTSSLILSITPPTGGSTSGNVLITLTGFSSASDFTIENDLNSTQLDISVKQESYDVSLKGKANVIGSYDLLGDLFIWSTPQTNLSSIITPTITGIAVGSAGNPSVVTTSSAHGLVDGELILISDAPNSLYNGKFIVGGVTSNTFKLGGTLPFMGTSGSGGFIHINTQGLGEIGVVTYDPNLSSNNFTYTRLIKSKQLNFVTKKQVDTYIEQNNIEKSIYWTDDYNPPRVLYYKGSYIQDGFITFYNSSGIYAYDTINQESILILSNTNFNFNFTGQSQAGGQLKSGNWRYSFRFLTENFVGTQWSELSNPIPVFKSDTTGTPALMSGDDANVTTGKINNFLITGITPNLFEYIEMAAINYVGNAIVGYIVSRTLLNSNTSISLSHTGLETDVTSLDLGTLNQIQANIQTAKNISVVDNRLILSNLTTQQRIDFSAWTQTWYHGLFKGTIDAVRLSETTLRIGEYNDPNNVFNFVGYMDNEVDRFGARFKLKNGAITDVFWIDDIIWNTGTTNITTPNRRTIGFSNYNLTDNSSGIDIAYVTYVQFYNITLDTIIDGTRARDLIDEIIIERAENVPEILATGMAAMTVSPSAVTPVGSLSDTGLFYNSNSPFTGYHGEYPFINSINDAGTVITYPSSGNAERGSFAFYSPDILYGNTSLVFSPGDKIFNYGNPVIKATGHSKSSGSLHYDMTYGEYNGYTNRSSLTTLNPSIISNVGFGEIQNTSPLFYSKDLVTFDPYPFNPITSTIDAQWNYIATPVIGMATGGDNLTNVSGNADYGFYYIQYKRPITYTDPDHCKYGDRTLTKYIPTGTKYIVTSASPSNIGTGVVNVYGGYVFTQKTYVKNRFAAAWRLGGIAALGFGGGVSFYSQNRVNSQLNKKHDNTNNEWNYPYPDANAITWLETTALTGIESVHYNTGYNIKNGINSFIAFDSNSPDQSDMPTRVVYSNLKPQDSLTDNYRTFLPLNFLDLDAGFGEVIHMANGNGELITWQPRKFQRQFFNTRGTLQTNPNLSVLIGDGSVLSRPGQTLTVFGTQHKWSVIKGKSAQGNDTFYWINAEMKKAIRFGYDGTISIADIHGMTSFLANNLLWISGKDNPADGQGICGVWNSRYAETIWVVRGTRNVTAWDSGHSYSIGDHVSYTPTVFSTFNQTGEIYVSLTNSNANHNPQFSTSNWAVVPHTDNNYYNEYSLVFNEFKNAFTAFYSPLPKILMAWTDSYLSPRPVSDQGRLNLHDSGNYCTWYDGDLVVNGYIEGIMNANPDSVKYMAAMRVNSDIVPSHIDFTTFNQISFLTSGEFTSREGNHDSPIKRDSTGTGINDNDTTSLFGKYLKVKMTFAAGIYQKLYAIIVKFRLAVRRVNE